MGVRLDRSLLMGIMFVKLLQLGFFSSFIYTGKLQFGPWPVFVVPQFNYYIYSLILHQSHLCRLLDSKTR